MSELDWAEFQARYVESPAYHEAGHTVAAAIQMMPLRERGIHVDPTVVLGQANSSPIFLTLRDRPD